MVASPAVAAGRSAPVAHPSVLPRRDEVMKVRHVPGHRDRGTRQKRSSSASILALQQPVM
jgi:hypothetical protein